MSIVATNKNNKTNQKRAPKQCKFQLYVTNSRMSYYLVQTNRY